MAMPTITNNSPSAGRIAWSAFGIQYSGASFPVAAGNTADRFVWWRHNGGSPVLQSGNTLPTDLTMHDLLLFLNKGGVGMFAPSTTVFDGGLIVPGSIFADAIASNAIQANHLDADVVTSRTIATDAVLAEHVSAGAVTTEKLSVGTVSDSRVANGSFEDGVQGWELRSGNGTAGLYTGVASSGAQALGITKGTTATVVAQAPSMFIPVTSGIGRRWYVSVNHGAGSALTGFGLRVLWFTAAKAPLSGADAFTDVVTGAASGTSWAVAEGQVQVPGAARYMAVALVNDAANNSLIYADEVVAREVVVAAAIGDGQITAPKLVAGAIETRHLSAGAITADLLTANNALAKAMQVEDLTGVNIHGVNIEAGTFVGGAISIAQGVESVLTENFSSASDTAAPSGWTRAAINSTAPGAGLTFPSVSGDRRMNLALRPSTASQRTRHVAYPTDLSAQDVRIEFDYSWSGQKVNPTFSVPVINLIARSSGGAVSLYGLDRAGGVGLRLRNGGIYVIAGPIDSSPSVLMALPDFDTDTLVSSDAGAAQGVVYRIELEMRGATILARAYRKGASPPTYSTTSVTNVYPAEGEVVFGVDTQGAFDGESNANQTVSIDNVRIETLRTGFDVSPDGIPTANDPLIPLALVNKRTLDRLAAPVVTTQNAPSGGTFSASVTATRVGNAVTVVIGGNRGSGSSTTYTTVVTLPVGWRPQADVGAPASMWFNSNTNYQWAVFSDGTVRVRMSGANSAGMAATISYNTTDPYPA